VRARTNLDRHPNYILAAYLAGAARYADNAEWPG
jgi:hypothetical protein